MKCPRCDAFIPDDTEFAFCPNCGADISPSSTNRPQESSAGQQTIVMPQYDHGQQRDAKALQPFSVPPSYPPPSSSAVPPVYNPSYQASSSYIPSSIPTSTAAIVSLVLGIVAWFALPLFGAIGAVIAGHMARREIQNSGGQIGGNGLAVAGLILGYIQLVIFALGICAFALLIVVASTSA